VRRLALAAALALLAGCAREERVVRWNPLLGSLPGAESGAPVVRGEGEYVDPTAVADDRIVLQDPATKEKTLLARTGRHLMVHIYTTLESGERELFTKQVLSRVTRDEYLLRGMDPGLAYDELARRRRDVIALFDALPAGERTPGARVRPLGAKAQRIEATGSRVSQLRWSAMDMVMEEGNWRLRWFVTPGAARNR